MPKFLCVNFNRYVTEESTQKFIEAETFREATQTFFQEGQNGNLDEETIDYIDDEYQQINDTYGCIPGEESDILIYKIE